MPAAYDIDFFNCNALFHYSWFMIFLCSVLFYRVIYSFGPGDDILAKELQQRCYQELEANVEIYLEEIKNDCAKFGLDSKLFLHAIVDT